MSRQDELLELGRPTPDIEFPMPPRAKSVSQTVITDAQEWLLSTLQIWGLVVLTLHLAAFSLPEESTWSLWPYTFLPAWLGWILVLSAGALIIPPINNAVTNSLHLLWQRFSSPLAPRSPLPAPRSSLLAPRFPLPALRSPLLASLLAGLLFWLARLRHLRWGDSYLLSVALSYPDLDLRVIYNWQAPLTVFLHQRLWQYVANPLLGWPVETVYATISIICGMIFVYILLTFLGRLGRNSLETAIMAGLILTTGSMQLFFGYVENYTVISLGLLIVLVLAWRALEGEVQPVWPVLALAITNGFHPSTVFLWPGMLLLVWLCWRRGLVSWGAGLQQTVLPPLVIGAGVFALMSSGGHGLAALLGEDQPGGGDTVWFVPLFAIDPEWANYQHYTMFSAAHFLDWGNVHFLIAPFGLPLIGLSLITVYRFHLTIFERQTERDYAYFLGATSACYLLLTWLWNADYGGRYDWDLFAPSAFVYTLLAGYLLVHIVSDREKLKAGGLFVIAVSLLHLGAWIFTNMQALPRR